MAKKTFKFLLSLTIVAAMVIVTTFMAYQKSLWRFNYPSLMEYPIQGLDVSHHQGDIRWNEISKNRFQFVYIKATEGGDFKDRKFQFNWEESMQAGFKTGAYHFFTLCRPGADQAKNFIESVPADINAMPPVIDLEFVGNCAKRPSKDDLVKELDTYDAAILEHYKTQPVLYTTYDFFDRYLKDTKYAQYPIWIRDIFAQPRTASFDSMKIWQYADNARIDGVDGPVDLNVMHE